MTTRTRAVGSPDATRAVDWEQRIDFPRLRQERLTRAKAALEASDLGAVLLFDPNNIRYVTSTHIGEWARDKNARFALLMRGADPILWDFGSAARHHQLFAPWLPPENFRAGVSPMRGAMPVDTGIPDRLGEKIAHELREFGLHDEPLGVDMADLVTIEALQRAGVHVTDGSQALLEARKIKTADEIALLDQSAGLVDAVYDEIYRMLRPGVYEHEIVARAHQLLFEMGSEQVEAVNAVSGDRCNPHPHVFSDRLLRPGDQAFFDIIHSFMGYRTCYYRTFNVGGVSHAQLDAYKQCREWLDDAIALVRPGMTTDKIAEVWPTAEELGFPDEETCFGLQFGHGIGVGLYESPMISRVHSLEHPVELEEGMVFALETYCAATDGRSAARIEEEVVVTATGCDVITRFPADELLVAGRTYVRGADLVARATTATATARRGWPTRSRPPRSSSPPASRDDRRDGNARARGRPPGYRLVRREDIELDPRPAGPIERPDDLPARRRLAGLDPHGADARLADRGARRRAPALLRDELLRARGGTGPLFGGARREARARCLRGPPVGTPHAFRCEDRARWIEMASPRPRGDGSDTFFLGPAPDGPAAALDARDPRNHNLFLLREGEMDLDLLSEARRWARRPCREAWRPPSSPTAGSP